MNLLKNIRNYQPYNEQEARDQAHMIDYMTHHSDYLSRENQTAHFSDRKSVV